MPVLSGSQASPLMVLLSVVIRTGFCPPLAATTQTSDRKPSPAWYAIHRWSGGANVIGRAPDATIQVDVAGVSRHHARIVVSNGEATLEDLGSKNGTFVEHKRITSTRLSDGDELRLGSVSLTFRIEPPQGPTDTVSEPDAPP
jgi:predicted component of type VI protein secretion system